MAIACGLKHTIVSTFRPPTPRDDEPATPVIVVGASKLDRDDHDLCYNPHLYHVIRAVLQPGCAPGSSSFCGTWFPQPPDGYIYQLCWDCETSIHGGKRRLGDTLLRRYGGSDIAACYISCFARYNRVRFSPMKAKPLPGAHHQLDGDVEIAEIERELDTRYTHPRARRIYEYGYIWFIESVTSYIPIPPLPMIPGETDGPNHSYASVHATASTA